MESGLTLDKLVEWVEESDEATEKSRREAERDRDYYDGNQWTQEEINTLKERKQPAIVINRIKPKVDYLVGFERQQRTDPKAYPRTPKHEQDAEAATDAIRFVCDTADWDSKRSAVFGDKIVEGVGGLIVEVEQGKREPKIVLRRIPWDRVIWDHRSREWDFSDARFKGIYVWMDRDEALAKYPDKAELIEAAVESPGEFDESRDDKPSHWYDKRRDRVRIVELYYKQGGVHYYCVFTKGGELVERRPSPYMDENGLPCCPIELQSCFIGRDNERYGVVRQLVGPQDEVNHRRSKAIHLLNSRQVILERGAVDDVSKAKKELAKADGAVEVNPGYKFEISETQDMAQGNLAMLAEAKAEIDAVGANAALTGKTDDGASGRAIQALQQGGVIELGSVFDTHRHWSRAVYRQIWARIKQFWTGEVWIRVTDDEQNMKFAPLNKPVMLGDGQIVKQGDVAQMDVDIIAAEAPDTVNIQQEQFDLLVQMYQGAPQTIPPDLVIEASTLRNKRQILERMRGGGEQNPLAPQLAQAMEAIKQLQRELAAKDAENQLKAGDLALKQDDQRLKARELDIKEVEVGMKAAAAQREVVMKHEETVRATQESSAQQSQMVAQSVAEAVGQGMGQVAQAIAAMGESLQMGQAQVAQAVAESNAQVAGAVQQMAAIKSQPRRVKRNADGSFEVH